MKTVTRLNTPANTDKWSYERWSKQYDINMKNYKFSLEREIEYRKVLGGTNGTRKTPYTNRQIDILKESEGYMGQLKTGKLYLTEQVKLDLKKDAYFVNKGFFVEYILESGASQAVLDTMDYYGIKYVLGSKIK